MRIDHKIQNIGLLFGEGETGFTLQIGRHCRGIHIKRVEKSESNTIKNIEFTYYDEEAGRQSGLVKIEVENHLEYPAKADSSTAMILDSGIGTNIDAPRDIQSFASIE